MPMHACMHACVMRRLSERDMTLRVMMRNSWYGVPDAVVRCIHMEAFEHSNCSSRRCRLLLTTQTTTGTIWMAKLAAVVTRQIEKKRTKTAKRARAECSLLLLL